MEKRIELEKRGRPANQVTELILDNCRSTSIVGLTDDFTALESLSLINVGLTTLKGFPTLPALQKLELSDNRISAGLSHLATSTKLTHLNLSGNKIKDLEELKALEKLPALMVLDLFNNEATSVDSYREKIFALIPSLKYLDGSDVDDVEVPSEEEEDDDLNGNDSEGEEAAGDGSAFSINGLEFDLDELEQYEQRLRAKRAAAAANGDSALATSAASAQADAVDDLDEYLDRLTIEEQRTATSAKPEQPENHGSSPASFAATSSAVEDVDAVEQPPPLPLAVFLYFTLGLLFFVSTVTKVDTDPFAAAAANGLSPPALSSDDGVEGAEGEVDGEEEDDEDDDDDDEEDDEGDDDGEADVSLSEVYNDNLEEDASDYVGAEDGDEDEEEEDDDDDDDEDDEDDESDGEEGASKSAGAKASASDAAAAPSEAGGKAAAAAGSDEEQESPVRGKKRKHDN